MAALGTDRKKCVIVDLDGVLWPGVLAETGAERFLAWTHGADTLFANAAEADALAGCADPAGQFARLAPHYQTVVIKRGAAGADAAARHGPIVAAAAASLDATDTTGAGDAFLAAFLLARLAGGDLHACLAAGVRHGTIAAGQPVQAFDAPDSLSFADFVGRKETYALRVRGNSMIDDHICDGDMILVENTQEARDGQIVVALVGGSETTLKRIYREQGNIVRLQPANETMSPIRVPANQVEIRGRLLAVLRKY